MRGILTFLVFGVSVAVLAVEPAVSTAPEISMSMVHEARESIQRGVNFLTDRQMADGSWGGNVAFTGLACVALHQSGTERLVSIREAAVERGRAYILAKVRESGAIHDDSSRYVNYSTAIALSALAIMGRPEDVETMRAARHFLIGAQLREDHPAHPTSPDDPSFGGIPYDDGKAPDLSNTAWVLEALYLTDHLDTEAGGATAEETRRSELAWERAIKFLQAVQRIPESAEDAWLVEGAPEADGGFVYQPRDARIDGTTPQTLRSYGSMTYAGLKSMIYARLDRDDFRVQAAIEWASKNYTLEENPGMGTQGLFFYIHTFSKAHAAFGEEVVKTADQGERHWRGDLVRSLLGAQRGDGSWYNDTGRWMESDPELVTSYALVAMQIALGPHLRP